MRLAALDIGSNSVKLLIVEVDDAGEPTVIYDRAIVSRLSKGMHETGCLSLEAMERTVTTVAAMMDEASVVDGALVSAIVTAPGRADNGPEFVTRLAEHTGVKAEIVSGKREANLTTLATQRAFPEAESLLVMDLGGASTELALVEKRHQSHPLSLDIGAVRLTEGHIHSDPPTREERVSARRSAAETFRGLSDRFGVSQRNLSDNSLIGVMVSGTATTLASVELGLPRYDPDVVHRLVLSKAQITALCHRLGTSTIAVKKDIPGMEPKRADVIYAGALIALVLMDEFNLPSISISDRGARWGVMWELLGVSGFDGGLAASTRG